MAFFNSNQHQYIGLLERCFFLVKNYFAATIRSYNGIFHGEQFRNGQMCSNIDLIAWTVVSGLSHSVQHEQGNLYSQTLEKQGNRIQEAMVPGNRNHKASSFVQLLGCPFLSHSYTHYKMYAIIQTWFNMHETIFTY